MIKHTAYLFILIMASAIMVLTGCNGCNSTQSTEKQALNVRLMWIPQTQFAGYIVALENGYYAEEGLDVTLHPAGPDLKPAQTVANNTDHFGVGVPNQIISARANGVPLTAIAQFFQDSPNRYILKSKNAITDLSQIKGKKVGLWLGGDEAEFVAMLKKVGLTLQDVELISQGYTVTPFLQDEYVLSMVTTYGELPLVQAELGDSLQILAPGDYGTAILGDMLFAKEDFIKEHPETVKKFLTATIKGWQFAIENPDKTLDIVLAYNPELDRESQRKMLEAAIALLTSGDAKTKGIGFINRTAYVTAADILKGSNQIDKEVDIDKTFDLSIWEAVPDSIKQLKN